jgi:hypothetical protein
VNRHTRQVAEFVSAWRTAAGWADLCKQPYLASTLRQAADAVQAWQLFYLPNEGRRRRPDHPVLGAALPFDPVQRARYWAMREMQRLAALPTYAKPRTAYRRVLWGRVCTNAYAGLDALAGHNYHSYGSDAS